MISFFIAYTIVLLSPSYHDLLVVSMQSMGQMIHFNSIVVKILQ